jgi:hypothetical protein
MAFWYTSSHAWRVSARNSIVKLSGIDTVTFIKIAHLRVILIDSKYSILMN